MSYYLCCKTHIHKATLLIAFYGFAISLLNAKSIVAIIFNVAHFFDNQTPTTEDDLNTNTLANIARRVYFLFAQTTPDARSLVYLNVFVVGVCCLLLAYGNRELRPGYYYPFIAFCIYKMMYCSSEVLESTMIILHKVPLLRVEHQAPTTRFILCIGSADIVILFIWAYFMDVVFRARRFMQDELLDPNTQLPRIHPTLLSTVSQRPSNIRACSSQQEEVPPPTYDWKVGDPVDQRSSTLPAYHP